MNLREKYAEKFGEEEAEKLFLSYLEHKPDYIRPNGWDEGEDSFISSIVVCIGLQCIKKDVNADYHKIKVSWKDFKKFCIENKKALLEYKGDYDGLGLFLGQYSFLLEKK